jgi:hypothetical protein
MTERTTENGQQEPAGDEPARGPRQGPGTRRAADRAVDEVATTANDQDEPTGDEDAQVPPRGWRQRLKTWQATVLAIGAIAAAIITVLDLKDRLFPGTSLPSVGRSASIHQLKLTDRRATLHAYCRVEFKDMPPEKQKCLAETNSPGNVFTVGITLKGYEGVCCRLLWTLTNQTLGIVPVGFKDFVAVPDIKIMNPLGDIRTFNVFVPNAAKGGYYTVQFTLADREGTITERESQRFLVR